jgi:superfamily II DNA or RNA helicase
VFLTYKMAEGINLQSADTLVLLGVTSNLKELIQGLGRIDRIDSQFGIVNYHLVDVPVGQFASDEKVANRIENYRTVAGEERNPHEHEFSIQLRAFDAARNGADVGIPVLMGLCSALLGRPIKGGLVISGGITLGGSLGAGSQSH